LSQEICSNCHTVVPEGAKFCTQCGAVSKPTPPGAGDDATSVIPTGAGPSDATAVIPTGPSVSDKVYDPNATVIGSVPPMPSGGDTSMPPGQAPQYGQPAYGQQSYPPPAPSYPPASPGASSYPPASPYPPAGASYPPAGASYPPAGASYPPAGTSYPPAAPSYPPPGGDQQWSNQPQGQQWSDQPQGQQWSDQPQGQQWSAPGQGTPTSPGKALFGGLLAIVAGVAGIGGVFLPWLRLPITTVSGWDLDKKDDPTIQLALGVVAVLVGIALVSFATGKVQRLLRLALVALGIGVLAVAAVDIKDVLDLSDVVDGVELGSGLFVLVGAGLALIVAAVLPVKKTTG
jgi:A-kinase anchor protein 5